MSDTNGPTDTVDNRVEGQPAATDGGSTVTGGDGLAGLLSKEENRGIVEAKKWTTADDVIEAYANLEKHASSSIKPPGPEATDEEWAAFYGKIGRPEKPDAYEFRVSEDLPKDFVYDKEFADEFRTWAHDAGLTAKQAAKLHDTYVAKLAKAQVDVVERQTAAVSTAHQELVKAWGDPESDGYKRNVELAMRSLQHGFGDDVVTEFRNVGLITENGEVTAPAFAKALAKMGGTYFAEDGLFHSENARVNPWSDENFNVTEQGRIYREDPERAKRLAKLAGKRLS